MGIQFKFLTQGPYTNLKNSFFFAKDFIFGEYFPDFIALIFKVRPLSYPSFTKVVFCVTVLKLFKYTVFKKQTICNFIY